MIQAAGHDHDCYLQTLVQPIHADSMSELLAQQLQERDEKPLRW
jgi:hypothetical protein